MKKNTFLTHLDTLKPAEVSKFGIHLNANSHDSKLLLKAYGFYVKYHNKVKPPPEPEVAFLKIFSRKPTSKADFKNLKNFPYDLSKKLKEYLIQKKIMETEFEKDFIWLQILEERGLEHQKNLHLKKLKKEKTGVKHVWDSVNQLKLNQYEYFRNDFQKNNIRLKEFQNGMNFLDDFYVNMKLKYSSEILNRAYVLSPPSSELFLLDSLLASVKKSDYDFTIQNELYRILYDFLQKRDFKKHVAVKEFVIKNEELLHQEERLTAFSYMINVLAAELKTGTQYKEEAFELYQMGLRKDKLLVYNGLMDGTNFFNIINIACRLKKFDWAKLFIKDHKQYLRKGTRKQSIFYALAIISFEEGDFQKAIHDLRKTTFNDVMLEMVARVYTLASYFELDKYDDLETFCDSFIRFANRNKNLGKDNTLSVVNFTQNLKHLSDKKIPKNQLKKRIIKEEKLFFRDWLLAKVEKYKPI
jgi:hypothetical protein